MMKNALLILIVLFTCSCNQENSSFKKDPKLTAIANYLDSLEGFSGAVLIAKKDTVLFKKAYGFAHIGHKVKNNTETKFSYASIGKSFTAVAIFQLIQAGKLSLDDPIGKFLPDYSNKIARDSITIQLLLTHRSGLPNFFASKKFLNTSKDHFRTIDDLAPLYENEPLESKPNERFDYRNTNYILLGRIIQVVSKVPYEQYIKENIFSIAKMEHTGNFDNDHPIENAAEGYTLSNVYPNRLQNTYLMSAVKGSSAGGGYTTLDDLYQFATAFKKKQLLNEKYTNFMKTEKPNGSYGFGMQFPVTKGLGIYGHSGGHFGVGAEWRIYEKQDYTVILLTNKDLDQGFLDARFFIQKTIAGSTPMLDRYFFTKRVVTRALEDGTDSAQQFIAANQGKVSEIDLNAKGYELIKRGLFENAIRIFKLEVFAFPESYDAYDSLGEAYMMNGDTEKAIENYNKSLELNPKNTNAKEKIADLLVNQ